ncbi:MAG: hypothetical protein Greene041662_147 [Candidatus Peregrinibacteria bacterium Greene0416_62]|nr:MAG: hypothetical protein Greene041662_147 [Candidatus Peregrinibacteria bacterium Greene0416_62]TSC99118.1 MAG: hypothetical protein Greene101449_740 [Candidatus Peregrinibacteria bacterium Greene1014_49]
MNLFPTPSFSHAEKCSRNSSGDISACRKTPRSVPTATSLWFGTTQPRSLFRRTIWLPFWRIIAKPIFCKVLRIFDADVRGSLGMRHIEGRDKGMPVRCQRELLQIQRRRLAQIRKSFLHGGSLTHRSHFRAFSNEDAVFLMNNCCKHVSSIARMVLAVTAYRAGNACNFCSFKRHHSSSTSRSFFSHSLRFTAFAQTPCAPRILPKHALPCSICSYVASLAIICSTYGVNMSSLYNFSPFA